MSKIPLPEEQPRYVIDEGMPPQKDRKILSEEQGKTLMKLVKAAGHVLSEEERDLITQLQQKLNKETDRVKSLKKLTVTDRPLDEYLTQYQKAKSADHKSQDSGSDEGESSKDAPVVTHVIGFKPEEVVRRYIECWNQQKFGAEYDCFSRDFLTHKREEYISARHLSYQQQLNGGGMRINFQEIVSSETFSSDAEVVARKVVQQGKRRPMEEIDRYRLKLEKGRWVIYAVEPMN